jgi:hypothetical protein
MILKPAMFCAFFLLSIWPLSGYRSTYTYDELLPGKCWNERYSVIQEKLFLPHEAFEKQELTPMEAIDLVKGLYAANFEKQAGKNGDTFYYKLPQYEYYLTFEGEGEAKESYLFHLYEFVLDEPEEGIGHTVTYGWYQVDKVTGAIMVTEQTR